MNLPEPLGLLFTSLVLIVSLFLGILLWLRLRPQKAYVRQAQLFTPAEWRFLTVLESVTDQQIRVFGQVRVADVLAVSGHLPRKQRWSAFGRISSKHFDFVLVDAKTGAIKVVIELNDRSHQRAKRAQRDAFLRDACKQADLPLLEIPVQKQYDPAQLQQQIASALRL